MRSQAACFSYLFLGGICCRAKACHQQPQCSNAHKNKHTDTHCWSPPLGLFVLLSSTFPTYTPTPAQPSPHHLPHPRCVSTCTSLLLSLLALLKCETAWNPIFPPLSLWPKEVVGGLGANQKLWNRGSSSISAGNHEPAQPNAAQRDVMGERILSGSA